MTIYKGRQATATPIGVRTTATTPIGVRTATPIGATATDPIERYITRMNNIMAQLLTEKKKEVAIARLDILKQEIALMKEKTT